MNTLLALLLLPAAAPHAEAGLVVSPAAVALDGKAARQRLIVSRGERDVTRDAAFRSATPGVVAVSPDGVVSPAGDGDGTVVATVAGKDVRVRVRVRDAASHRPPTFERDVLPVLARAGCNGGPCHGKARGQGGFALSLLGYDPDADHAALVSEGRGRRVFPADQANSLLLRKASGSTAHGGGRRLPADGPGYALLLRWLDDGAPRTPADAPALDKITVEPSERTLAFRAKQQLLVTAHYGDGRREDVTHLATFQSSESVLASVDADGLVTAGPLPGEAAVMARFMDRFAVANVLVPLPGKVEADLYARLPRHNFIDGHVWTKLRQLGVTPSEPAPDETFLRRAHLDLIGRLPTPDEVRAFLADARPGKRERLVDALLKRPEYGDFWANKWADLLRPNPYRVGIKAVFELDSWLRASFRENKPYDAFVREILSAKGSTFRKGPATVFRDRREPDEITTMMSQLFLGVRLDCARCHHHPFEVWGQDDFYGFAAFFGRIGRKGVGLSPPISGGEEVITLSPGGEVRHPVTKRVMTPRPLGGKETKVAPDDDPREALAAWVTSKDNPTFAKAIVNRVWADLMGRGLVEPVDDLRATNPPSNGPLLEALAEDFRRNGHDLKKLLRTVATSYAYGLSSRTNARNAADTRNHSRHYRQRLRAEVLLDAVSDVTGVAESFSAMPLGSRAMEVWTARTPSLFLDSFGRPDPNQDPPCERTPDTTVVQALHLMNSPGVHRKVTSDSGRAAKLAAGEMAPVEIVRELYALAYGRRPTAEETKACLEVFADKETTRRQAVEDVLWALLNTPEFVFVN